MNRSRDYMLYNIGFIFGFVFGIVAGISIGHWVWG